MVERVRCLGSGLQTPPTRTSCTRRAEVLCKVVNTGLLMFKREEGQGYALSISSLGYREHAVSV